MPKIESQVATNDLDFLEPLSELRLAGAKRRGAAGPLPPAPW